MTLPPLWQVAGPLRWDSDGEDGVRVTTYRSRFGDCFVAITQTDIQRQTIDATLPTTRFCLFNPNAVQFRLFALRCETVGVLAETDDDALRVSVYRVNVPSTQRHLLTRITEPWSPCFFKKEVV